MPTPQAPSSQIAQRISAETRSENRKCWTCGSCDFECPVNVATGGRLRPQRLVRLASLGFSDELINASEIWYCLQCNRCRQVCPNLVSPSDVIAYARTAAMQQGVVPGAFYFQHAALQTQRQRLTHQAAVDCAGDRGILPFRGGSDPIHMSTVPPAAASRCWTCGECSSTCPATGGRDVFDPRSIFRAAALGLTRELMQSPAIWLCLSCGRCTDVCSQGIDGRQIISELQRGAVAEGFVEEGFPFRWQRRVRVVHRCWVNAVELLIGRYRNPAKDAQLQTTPDMVACINTDTYGETIPFPNRAQPHREMRAAVRRHA